MNKQTHRNTQKQKHKRKQTIKTTIIWLHIWFDARAPWDRRRRLHWCCRGKLPNVAECARVLACRHNKSDIETRCCVCVFFFHWRQIHAWRRTEEEEEEKKTYKRLNITQHIDLFWLTGTEPAANASKSGSVIQP